MKPTFTIRKNFHYQNFLILCLLLAGTVTGFSRETNDLRSNPYLRSETVNPSYLERYKEGVRTLYSFKKIIAGFRDPVIKDNTTPTVYAKAMAADIIIDGQCYSDVFHYCVGEEIEIEIEAEEGYLNYKWFKDGVEIAGATGNVYTITAPGSYHFTAEDAETCDARLCCPYLVTQESGFDAVITKTDAACAVGATGSITVTPTEGEITDYTYSLDGGPFQVSNTFSGLTGGSYTVTVKNAAGCKIEKTVEVSQPGGITALAETECEEDLTTATIVASGGVRPYTYSLNGGAFGSDSVFAALAQGQHEIVVKDANGCTYKVNVDAYCQCTPEIFEYCPGEPIEILAEAAPGQGNYQWYKNGEIIEGATDSVYTITAIGNYHYTSGGDDTCEGELCCPIIVREKEAPAVHLEGGELSCTVTSIQLTTGSDPANTFSWSGPDGFTGNTPSVTVTAPGTYIVIVTGASGCSTADTAVVTLDGELPTVTVAGGELTCDVSSLEITADASAGVTYSWSGPGGFTATTQSITATAAGDYIVTVTSANGCIAKDTAVVTQDKELPTVTTTGGELNCDVTSLEITANGSAGVTYEWSGPDGFTATTQSITATTAGNYIVTVTSANGCIAKDTAVVTQDKQLPTVTTTGGELNCDVTSLEITANGGAGVTYSWSGPGGFTATTQSITATAAGDYIITVTSANGCIAKDTATVTQNKELPTVTTTGGELTCDVTSLEITANGSAGVTYSWSGPGGFTATTQSITATVSGSYTVTVTAANGCIAKDTAIVTQDKQLPTVTVTGGKLTCIAPSLEITANGSADVTYSWSGPGGFTATTQSISATVPGSYIVTVTSANGCIAKDTAIVTLADTPTLSATPSCVDNKGKVTLVASGGQAPYTYSKDGVIFQEDAVFTGLINGNYVFTVKDANGCIFTTTVAVKCEIECIPQIYSFCENEVIEVTIEAEEGLENYQWYRNGEVIAGATGWIYTATQPGRYYYTAGTGDLCDGILCCPIDIARYPGFVATATAGDLDCTNGPVVPVTITVAGGTMPFTYSKDGITFGSNPVFLVGPGTHKFYVKDANGCINETNSIVVPEIEKPKTPIVTVDTTTVCDNGKATLTAACENGEVVQWNNNMVGTMIQVGEGTYWAVCSNICGVSPASAPVTISKKPAPTAPLIATDKTFICGNELATLTANCTVGDVIEWSNGMYGDKIQVGIGIYSARCKNECGISKDSGKITITGDKVPGSPEIGTDKPMVCGEEKATLVAECSVGSFVVWSNGMIGSPIQVGEGIYTAICRNDCGDSENSRHITINKGMVPPPPTISPSKVFVCGEEKVKLSAICQTGSIIQWSNGMEGGEIYVGAGIYRAVCKNTCGTSAESIPVIISKDKDPAAPSIATDRTTVCGEEKATLSGLCESGMLIWSHGQVGSPIQVGPGTYTARCSNDCGISVASTPVTITTGGVPDKPIITAEKTTVCGDEQVKLTAYCASGTVSWIGVSGFNPTVYVGTGIYAARCTNACGTSVASNPITITPGTTPVKPIITSNVTGVCGEEKAILTGTCLQGGDLVWSNGMTGSPIQVGIGFYTARCVNACGTSPASDMIAIETGRVPGRPTIAANKTSVCGDEKATLTGSCPTGGTLIWSNGMSGSPVLVGAGTYYATCVNACGTSPASVSVTITTGLLPGKPVISADKLMVCGDEKATLSGICPSGGNLSWSNGMTGGQIQVSAGTYYANCVSECGSSVNSETIVIVPGTVPVKPTISTDKTSLCEGEVATLTGSCLSGTLVWSNGLGGTSIQVGPGTYTAVCTNSCGTSPVSNSITINRGPVPSQPLIQTNKLTVCGNDKAMLTGSCPTGGTLTWSTGQTGSPILVGPGSYTATCSNTCGSSAPSTPVTIGNGVPPSAPVVTPGQNYVCDNDKTTLTATCTNGTVLWSTGATTAVISVGAGSYTAVCINDCGSSGTSVPVVIEQKNKPSSPVIVPGSGSICANKTTTLTATCPAGSTVLWSNGSTANPLIAGPGTYTAVCVNECGSSQVPTTVTIHSLPVPAAPTVVPSKTVLCGAETATLTATCTSGTVLWNDGTTANPRTVGAGTYTATCVNNCGASPASTPVVITTQPAPEKPHIATNKSSVCGDEKATLTGSCPTGGTLTWSTGQTGSPILVGAGTYTATCVSTCGTSASSDPIVIGTGSTPSAPTVVPSKTVLCGAETATLTATCTSGTVLWNDGTTANPRTVGAGTYTASCVTSCGTSPASTPVVITTQPAPEKPHIATNKSSVCGDEKATLTGSCPTGGTLTWSTGQTGSPILVGAGTYTATCVSTCGTSATSDPIVIGTGSTPSVPTVVPSKTVLCGAETAMLTATCSSGTVLWNDGTTANPRTVGAGTYTASCVTSCGTSAASTPVVITTQPAPEKPHIATNKSSVCGDEKATLTGSCPTGGTLTWSTGQTGSPILVGAGTYTATCVSTCGTSASSDPIVIGTGSTPSAPTVVPSKTVLCGAETATLTATCTSGTVLWNDGTTANPRTVGAGIYTASCVTNCGTSPASTPVVITTQPAPEKPHIATNKSSVCGDEKATLTGSCPTGGTLTWSTGQTGSPILVGAGTYTATCVSTCGTSAASDPIVIGTGSTPSVPTVVPSKTVLCGAETATLTATCSSGTVLWNDGTTANPRTVGAGTYTASCVTSCGTSPASTPVVITTQPAPEKPHIATNKSSVCGDEKATLTGSCPTGGTLTWSTGQTGSPILVGAGTYTATCVSTCGTSAASDPIVIGTGSTPAAPSVMTNTNTVCGTDKATIAAVCTSGTVLWSDGNTTSPRQVGAGTYTATCVTTCGTSPASTQIVITQGSKPAAPTVTTNVTTVCDNEKATLTATCSTGTVLWNDGSTANPRQVGAGTYTATCVNACGGSANSNTVVINRGPVPTKPTVQTNRSTVCGTEKATLTGSCPTGGTLTWSNGQTGSPVLVGVGSYTATCVNSCGASEASAAIVIGDGSKPAAPVVTTNKSVLCGTETATLTATGCAGGTIHWSNGGTGTTKVVTAGTYTATCVTSCGTSDNSTPVTITQETAPANFTISTSTATVCGTEKATLTATGCEGGTVTWSTGATGASIQVGAGSYSAICKTNCGGTVSAGPLVINQQTPPARPSVTTDKATVCGDEKATLTASGCAGTISWYRPGVAGPALIGNGATVQVGTGTYTATCTTSCGTSPASDPVTIGTSDKPAAPSISADKSTVCEGEKATLTATGCAGTVTWSNGATGTSTQVGAGTYTATCTTSCGTSSSSLPVTIGTSAKPAAPAITTDKTLVCEGEKAQLVATGCAGTVTWSTGATGTNIQVGAGTYTATCTSGCGTSNASAPVTIGTSTKPAAPSVSTNKSTVCENEKATLTATGCAGTVSWSNGTTGTSIQVGAGTYSAACNSACGLSAASTPVTIGTSDKPAAPSVSADKATVCEGEKATLTATGCAGTITWSTGQTVSVIQVGAGTYTATCTTSCGTSAASTPVTIGTSDKPAAPSVSANKATVCEGEVATLTASGCAGTVTWSTGQTVSVIQVGAGTYTATCTTSCGTSAASTPVTIGTSDKPAAPSVSADKATVCEGEKVTLTAGGCAGTVTWSTGATGVSIQVGAGTYTATCTTSCGTSDASAAVTIGTSDKPAAPSVNTDKSTVCEGEVATLTASGCAGTVTWSTGATGTSIQVGAGTYTATCTTSCGTSDASATVTIGTSDKPAAPSLTTDKTTVCDNEVATLTASGCAGTVTWSTGATGTSIQVGAGTYTATCTTGCGTSEVSSPVTIGTSEKPAKPMITASGNSVCGEEKVTLTASGCSGTVNWSNGETGTSILVSAGTYTATCTTGCGTSDAAIVSISEGGSPEPPVVTADKGSICGNEKAILTATGCMGGVIHWSTGETGFQIEVGRGVYTATCVDACGNESIACIAVEIDDNATAPDAPEIWASTDGVCGEELATLTANGCTGGTVIWSNGSEGYSIQVSAGTYTAICKTDCGESAASNSVIVHAKGGTLSISSDKTAYCAGETVTLTASGCANGTVRWSNGATGSSITLQATASATMTAVCSVGGSTGSCDFAVGDVEFNYQAQQNPNGMNTRFLLTDNSYEILQVKTTPKFENVQAGTYKVISLVYIGEIPGLAAGANYSNLDKGECYSDEETEISVCNPDTPGEECEAVGSITVQVKTAAECDGGNGGDGGSEACETAPTVISSVGSATCLGTSVTLTALNCNAQVVWNTGATGASINFVPTETGAYKFSAKCVSTAAGCESEVSQEITVNVVDALSKPIAIETLNNICPLAYVDLRNAILGEPTTGGTFEFRYGNSPSSALVTSAQVTSGVYYLFERNTAGCYSEGTAVTVVISDDCENPVHPTAVDVAIHKTGDKETAEVNEEVTYTVTVSNVGENEATDIRVRDIIPVGLQITQVSENAYLEDGVVRISLDALAPGASVEVTYTGTVMAPGRIANKAELEAVGQNDTNLDNNSSTWVINNVAQVDSLIGLAKAVGTVALREDLGANVYEVPFLFTITNMGLKDLDYVRLTDTLSLTFGNAEMIESVHLEADPGLTVNPNYTGSGEQTDLLIAEESAIAAGATLNVRMKVFVNMGNSAGGHFANSATVYAGTDNEISDRSTDGVNPDPDNDGDPTNNSTPTEFTIGEGTPEYGIGAALVVVDSAFVNDRTGYEVKYLVQIRNFGPDTISGVFLTDTLMHTFADAPDFTVTGTPVVISQGSSLVVNPDFDGKTDFRLLLPEAEAVLAPGQTDSVEFRVTVVFGTNVGPYSNNVIAFGEDNGTLLTDTSNAGTEIIKHLSTPTVFNIPGEDVDPRSLVEIPEGFSPNGDGINDNWKIELKGDAKIEKLIIVNRYGATLYEEDGETVSTIGWDGKANKGVIPGTGTVPTGTYYYKLKLVGQDKYIIDYISVER